MREFEERRRARKLLHSRYAIALLLVALAILSRGAWGAYQKHQKSEEIMSRIEDEYRSLQEREAGLRASLSELETDEGKEREVRDRFGAVREGERLIILVEEEASAERAAPLESRSFWDKIKAVFTRD